MSLLSVDDINEQFLHYEAPRNARNWLKQRGLVITRIGKQYFVQKIAFETLIKSMAGVEAIIKEAPLKLKPAEEEIFTHLRQKIDRL